MKPEASSRLPSRKTLRLPHYDYSSPGAYFVTIVAHKRLAIFGHIEAGMLIPSEMGKIIESTWNSIPTHFPDVSLDVLTVMPNHIHGIIVINAGAAHASQVNGIDSADQAKTGAVSRSLNAVLQNFKSVSTRKINQQFHQEGGKIWQRNYFERVIRNQEKWKRIREYIIANPINWESDPENI